MSTKTFQKILFAVDRSEHSRAATPAVAQLAQVSGAAVLVTHVWNSDSAGPGKGQTEMPLDARKLVEGVVRRLEEAGVQARYELRTAPQAKVAEEIALAARESSADLIAIGTRGLSEFRSLFLGSVSHRVIAHTDRPVLVVRAAGDPPGGQIKRILLAIAGGEDVPNAVEATTSLALGAKAEVMVLHVRYLLASGMGGAFVEPEEESAKLVADTIGTLREAGVVAEGASLLDRRGIAREIVESARDWNADLVVIGSRRLSELGSIFQGGIGHEVMHLSSSPVLVAERPDAAIGAGKS